MVDRQLKLIKQTIHNKSNIRAIEHDISLSCPVNYVSVSCVCDTQLRNSCILVHYITSLMW